MSRPTLDDMWVIQLAEWLGETFDGWLPVWVEYIFGIPFFLSTVALACVEYLLRFLLTPAKYWR